MKNVFDMEATVFQQRTAEGLDEKLLGNWRISFVEFAFQLGNFLFNARSTGVQPEHMKELNAILDQCLKMSRIPGQEGKIVLRFRGRGLPGESGDSEKFDYVFRFGNMEIDLALAKKIGKRGGVTTTHLPWRLRKSFENLAAVDINTLFLDIGTGQEDELNNIRRSLEIFGNYLYLTESGDSSPPVGKEMPTLIYDEKTQPDPNLTLLAAFNKVSAKAIQELVPNISKRIKQAKDDTPLAKCSSVYDAIFHFNKLRDQLKRPPLEINDAKWLMVAEDEEIVKVDDVPLSQKVLNRIISQPEKTKEILASAYGDVLLGFNAVEIAGWLEQVGMLAEAAGEDEGEGRLVVDGIIGFIKESLEHVADDVLDELEVDGNEVSTEIEDGNRLRIHVHEEVGRRLAYLIKRCDTRGKMRDMLSGQVSFNDEDYAIIVKDFSIPIEGAQKLLGLLQSCFDRNGHFLRKVFEGNIHEFVIHEKNIFQFLWHYLKQIDNRQDRVAYLNTLQMLISEMNDPAEALLVLLADFIKTPMQVTFFDRNSLILCNILLRKYNQELRNEIEITPEEVLMVRAGLDRERVSAALDQVNVHQEKFYQKIRLIHENLHQALNPWAVSTKTLPVRYLITLEREAFIFLSLIGGEVAHKIIRDAAEEFGNPHSKIYMLEKSSANIPSMMQLFKVIIRALNRFRDAADLPILKSLLERENAFMAKVHDNQYLVVKRVMEWAERSIRDLEKANSQ